MGKPDKTLVEYRQAMALCEAIFSQKMSDYGVAWRILRPESLTDQIYIKARRIRSVEMKGIRKVDEDICSEYIGIANYCIMALIQLEKGFSEEEDNDLPREEILPLYRRHFEQALTLMCDKNHDYDEAWRKMRVSSITDLILMKIRRIKEIEDHGGKTVVSEGIEANYTDMINYAVFALIRLKELG